MKLAILSDISEVLPLEISAILENVVRAFECTKNHVNIFLKAAYVRLYLCKSHFGGVLIEISEVLGFCKVSGKQCFLFN